MCNHTDPFHGSDLRTIALKALIGWPDCDASHRFIALPTIPAAREDCRQTGPALMRRPV